MMVSSLRLLEVSIGVQDPEHRGNVYCIMRSKQIYIIWLGKYLEMSN